MLNRTPKVHIVYCHPSEKSITNTIKQGYIDGLYEINISYTITDLYGSNFNSDITEEEYLRENNNIPCPLAEDVILEQEKINNDKKDLLSIDDDLISIEEVEELC